MPQALSYPGVYVEEIPSGVRTITGVATSITAFVGRSLRGKDSEPSSIFSFLEYERKFGGLWSESPMSFAVQQYFQNGGGQALIVRVHQNAQKARVELTTDTADVTAFVLEAANPGAWGGKLRVTVSHGSPALTAPLFNLTIEELDGTIVVSKEVFLKVSPDPGSPRFVKDVLANESVLALVASDVSEVSGNRPIEGNRVAFETDPAVDPDGAAVTASQVFGAGDGKGINALERVDLFNILCIPPYSFEADVDNAAIDEATAFCRKHRAVLLVDPPAGTKTVSAAILFAQSLSSSSYGALYFPRILAPNALKQSRLEAFAPCGAVAGVLARTDATRGVWKSAAGIDATLSGVFGLATKLTDNENGQLNPLGINCLRDFPVYGRVVWGARTLDGADQRASEWKYLAVRRTALFIEESLYRGTQWVVFEPNDEPLWSQIRLNIGAFMQNLFRLGAFQGKTPRDAYFVKCDRETTTQTDINSGIVNIMVGFAPLKPAEFVVIKLQQMAGDIPT